MTLTTVGYREIHPITPVGQLLASMVMVMGYGIIAVPTGIVTVELAHQARSSLRVSAGPPPALRCPACRRTDPELDARHCKGCGTRLEGRE